MSKKFEHISAIYLVLQTERKILLSRRYNTGYEDGSYSLIAGYIHGDEPLANAMCRKAKEEANIIIKPENLLLAHVMHRKQNEERMNFFFISTTWQGEIRNLEPHKCDDLNWFPEKDLPTNTILYIKQALNSIAKGVFYSEFGWI